jgi:hypothetical protein
MDAELWRNAIQESQRSGVPAVALVAAYQRLVTEHAGEAVTPELLAQAGQHVVDTTGVEALLDDQALAQRDQLIQKLAERLGISTEAARGVYDGIQQGVVERQREQPRLQAATAAALTDS